MPYKRICLQCGVEFVTFNSEQDFCKKQCRDRWYKKEYGKRTCTMCGKEFVGKSPFDSCCSKECDEKFKLNLANWKTKQEQKAEKKELKLKKQIAKDEEKQLIKYAKSLGVKIDN